MKYIPTLELEGQAEQLLASVDALDVPTPLDVVAHRLGLHVEEVPLGEDISGVLVVSGGRGMIGVNLTQPVVRRRFTIAHEIAHFVLHRDESELFIDKTFVAFRDSDSGKGARRAEIQANQFAAALLMPAELIERELGGQVVDLAATDVIEELAERFLVSSQSMTFRLDNLGLITADQ